MSVTTVKVQGSDLQIGMIVAIAGMHYFEVVADATSPNGIVLSAIKGLSTAIQDTIFGQPDTVYHTVENTSEFQAFRESRSRYPSANQVIQGQVHSGLVQPDIGPNAGLGLAGGVQGNPAPSVDANLTGDVHHAGAGVPANFSQAQAEIAKDPLPGTASLSQLKDIAKQAQGLPQDQGGIKIPNLLNK